MTQEEDARDALLKAITTHASSTINPLIVLRLAEAYAWLMDPSQPHGSAPSTG